MKKSINRKMCLCVLICSFLLPVNAQVYNFRYKPITISALMDSISAKTNIKVSYDARAVPVDSLVQVDVSQMHPFDLLKSVLKDRPLHISYRNNQIVISEQVQEDVSIYLRFKGKVIDGSEGDALPMVNIAVKNKAMGTISNMDGEFEFVVPANCLNDTLVFSFIGYSNEFYPIKNIESTLTVRLRSHDIKLQEIEVRYEAIEDIINGIVKNRSKNYINEQTILTGFFRESIKQDQKFVQVSEAIIEIQKPSYNEFLNLERVRFVKGRKLSGLQTMESVNFKLEGGPYQFSRIDVARYLEFLPKDGYDDVYQYSYEGIDYLNDEMVYRIGFRPIEDDGELKYEGIIMAHSQSYAIVHVDFELTKRSLKNSRKALIKRSTRRIKAKPRVARYYIDYRRLNDKWIVNKIGGEIAVYINDKDEKINSEFVGISELLVSDCKIDREERFKTSELYKSNYILADEIKETDQEFWDNYNIIKPDDELEKVFKDRK
ncbi:carboxypeptidase-like regulatory domain-containing protein [Carboxylicivirga caseinilyticus]|uniref:carboxypeptidase-like regulatory domain-containing protein n=1 Tax=Carboxylicivirga caseinilyticus TaxID=3417572 RepID=UPI003D339857|nr:carboxypeptidase-like regulatory domain-containing protein [Marinilabiliaceae bacterium A049]